MRVTPLRLDQNANYNVTAHITIPDIYITASNFLYQF